METIPILKRRNLLRIALLAFIMLQTVTIFLPAECRLVPSVAYANPEDDINLYGVWCTDTRTKVYGKLWNQSHIDMVADAGGNYIAYAIDKTGWYENSRENVLGIPFKDYVETMVTHGNARSVSSLLVLGSDYGFGDQNGDGVTWGSYEKNMQINNSTLRAEWIQWGRDMISHCHPWGVLVMDEPGQSVRGQPLSQQDYWDFADECIAEWKKVKPDIYVITYGGGGSLGNRYLTYYHSNPLHTPNGPHDNILYTSVCYWWSLDTDYQRSPEQGKQALDNWLVSHGVTGEIAQLTVLSVGVKLVELGVWDYLGDVYQWCFDHAYGLMHFTCDCKSYYSPAWNLLKSPSEGGNYDDWSGTFGQYWVDNVPETEPPPPHPRYNFFDGFERGDFSNWNITTGDVSIVDSPVHCGGYSCSLSTSAKKKGLVYLEKDFTSGLSDLFVRYYFRFGVLPTGSPNNHYFLVLRDNADDYVTRVRFQYSASLQKYRFNMRTDAARSPAWYSSSYMTLAADTWYCIEARRKADATSGIIQLWLDDALIIDYSGDTGTESSWKVQVGPYYGWTGVEMLVDCVAMDKVYIGMEKTASPSHLDPSLVGYGMSGVCFADTGGNWGAQTDEHQLNLIRDAGAKMVKFSTNWYGWLNSDSWTDNPLGVPYKDYIKQLCDWCREKGLISCLGLHCAKGWSMNWEEKVAIIEDAKPFTLEAFDGELRSDPRQDYIDWAVDMVSYCDPDWMDVMSENTRPVSFDNYRDFCIEIMTAYRSVKPSIHVIVEGKRVPERDGRTSWSSRLDDFMVNPLPFDNVLYDLHRYWTSDTMPDCPGAQDFIAGRFAEGRAAFYDYFDYLFSVGDHASNDTLWPNVIMGEWGAYAGERWMPIPSNWDEAMLAFYDWCRDRDVPFLQWAFGYGKWNMLTSDWQNLNPAGQLWAKNLS